MDSRRDEPEQAIKKVVLPSGKTIDVVYLGDESASRSGPVPVLGPSLDLHVCRECGSKLAYPTAWAEAEDDCWSVAIRCPECELMREGVFTQDVVERFDTALDAGTEALTTDYRRLVRANMVDEVERFAGALRAGALLPEDF